MGSANFKVTEPSMEDILASIRRIISDDQETVREPEHEEPDTSPLKNVLDLAERHVSSILESELPTLRDEEPENATPLHERPFQLINPAGHRATSHEAEQPAPQPLRVSKPVHTSSSAAGSGESLLSSQAHASVSGAFDRLGAAVTSSEPQTVEGLMKEMLRPMLKAWLDDHLPAIVERLVQAEIERVTRCRG